MTRVSILTFAVAAALPLLAQTTDVKPNNLGQKIVDQEIVKHPEIVVLVFHTINKDKSDYPITASNIGRFGKKADEDDLRCIKTGKANLEINKTKPQFEVEMRLHDSSKKNIGAIAVVYPYKPGDDKEALRKKAEGVRAEIEKQIPSVEKLTEPAQ
jgi:hypothetical protein